eukprot:CAMPEP_0116966424 /NCGR_PEP_ID=MMETSP0467-20121206/49849_1 /TAXON_ID=283647 /ORGANISM="Mesodinium pulex, Strain SPMC105" /LENGTH=58 /DNA_ID=CAMNT_0004655943 /DNA_START=272 /DNA_END=448 /DNA_ORIENTATION=+
MAKTDSRGADINRAKSLNINKMNIGKNDDNSRNSISKDKRESMAFQKINLELLNEPLN